MNKHELGKEQGIGVQELQEFRSQELPESARQSPFSATPELLQLLNSYLFGLLNRAASLQIEFYGNGHPAGIDNRPVGWWAVGADVRDRGTPNGIQSPYL